MLYFDQEETNRVGTIRQQIWALLHFPFHVCILLVVEGLSRLSIWIKVLDVVTPYSVVFNSVLQNWNSTFNVNATTGGPTGEYLVNLAQLYNESAMDLFDRFPNPNAPNITSFLEAVKDSDGNPSELIIGAESIFEAGFGVVTETFGIDKPEHATDLITGIFELFYSVFIYFFAAAGLTLVLLAVLFWIGKRRKLRGEVLSISFRAIIGIGLCGLSLMGLPQYQNNENSALNNWLYTPWLLPTVVLCYGLGMFCWSFRI